MKVISLNKFGGLISKAQKNDRKAQQRLYEMLSPKMLSICRYYVSGLNDAEEIMLTGFYKIFLNIKKFQNKGSFEGWVRKIMVREAISFIRSRKQLVFNTDKPLENEVYTNNIQIEINTAEIQQLIDNLPEGYRLVFIMYAIEGYKHHEIAQLLNISVGTSKSQLFKARQVLQQKIKKINNIGYGTR